MQFEFILKNGPLPLGWLCGVQKRKSLVILNRKYPLSQIDLCALLSVLCSLCPALLCCSVLLTYCILFLMIWNKTNCLFTSFSYIQIIHEVPLNETLKLEHVTNSKLQVCNLCIFHVMSVQRSRDEMWRCGDTFLTWLDFSVTWLPWTRSKDPRMRQ